MKTQTTKNQNQTTNFLMLENLPKSKNFNFGNLKKIDTINFDFLYTNYKKSIDNIIIKNNDNATLINIKKTNIFNINKLNDFSFSFEMILNIDSKNIYANCIFFLKEYTNSKFNSFNEIADSFILHLLEKNAKLNLEKNKQNLIVLIKKQYNQTFLINPKNSLVLNTRLKLTQPQYNVLINFMHVIKFAIVSQYENVNLKTKNVISTENI